MGLFQSGEMEAYKDASKRLKVTFPHPKPPLSTTSKHKAQKILKYLEDETQNQKSFCKRRKHLSYLQGEHFHSTLTRSFSAVFPLLLKESRRRVGDAWTEVCSAPLNLMSLNKSVAVKSSFYSRAWMLVQWLMLLSPFVLGFLDPSQLFELTIGDHLGLFLKACLHDSLFLNYRSTKSNPSFQDLQFCVLFHQPMLDQLL